MKPWCEAIGGFAGFGDEINAQLSVLVVEEAGVLGENHRPWASNW
jgi:hypothetical protein